MSITTIGLDADDTLWHSESHFAVTEERFGALVSPWLSEDEAASRLLDRERHNLSTFGYGVKGFTLSMVETAIEASDGSIPSSAIQNIIDWGKAMLSHPVELLEGVAETIDQLKPDYQLAIITKGDLFHQESKIAESGLAERFDHVEILSEKSPESYGAVLERLGTVPSEFVMVGNSVRSDVLPVVELGGQAVHIPYGITWGHEKVNRDRVVECWHHLDRILDLPDLLRTL